MKATFTYVCTLAIALLVFASCSKSNTSTPSSGSTYPTGTGHVTGSGGLTFDLSGTSTQFSKKVDTVIFYARIDTTSSYTAKGLTIGVVVKGTGVINFDNAVANPSGPFTSGAVGLYVAYYGSSTNGQTHILLSQSGSMNVTSFSSNHIEGTYTVTVVDGISSSNGGVAPITLSGNFAGNY
ncbi:MAG: hypothetical protein QM726_16610 [Chitinophagaceae bacterium]